VDFKDISARMKKAKGSDSPTKEDKPYDYAESYRLRGKMLGVMIADARTNAKRTVEDCARLLNVEPSIIQAWEFGDAIPSLPQLELLAYYLDVHVSHFWSQKTLQSEQDNKGHSQAQYIELRQRMIGALLQQAREEKNLSIEQLAEITQIDADRIQHYEFGNLEIPMHELSVLANEVNKNMSYFLESESYIGELLRIREEWKHFLDLDETEREFAANPLNIGFIQIAMLFSKMPVEKLRKVAEGMLEITM